MKRFEDTAVLLSFGCWGYPLMELLWRGWTHWSMALAGGLCFGILGKLSQCMANCRVWTRCAAGAAAITTVEFLFGCIFNLGFHMNVWDYSSEHWNLAGQICARYSAMWFVLSGPLMGLADRLSGQRRTGHAIGNQRTKHLYHTRLLSKGRAGYRDTAGDRDAAYGR